MVAMVLRIKREVRSVLIALDQENFTSSIPFEAIVKIKGEMVRSLHVVIVDL